MALKQTIVLLFLAFIWVNSVHSQSYVPPKVKNTKHKSKNIEIQSPSWDEDARFKVETSASPERELASGEEVEDEVPVRNPSSNSPVVDKKTPVKQIPADYKPKSWKYVPEEESQD